MPSTVNHQITYPAGNAAPNVPLVMQTLAESVDTALSELTRPFGHMGKTDGFQTVTTAGTLTMSAAQELKGGVTFDNAADALVVPVAGLYRITAKLYSSGGVTGRQTSGIMKLPAAGGAAVSTGVAITMFKGTTDDYNLTATGTVRLAAGDKVYMTAQGNASAYGGDGYGGCFLEVEFAQA